MTTDSGEYERHLLQSELESLRLKRIDLDEQILWRIKRLRQLMPGCCPGKA
jgi:hypothetical protein